MSHVENKVLHVGSLIRIRRKMLKLQLRLWGLLYTVKLQVTDE